MHFASLPWREGFTSIKEDLIFKLREGSHWRFFDSLLNTLACIIMDTSVQTFNFHNELKEKDSI